MSFTLTWRVYVCVRVMKLGVLYSKQTHHQITLSLRHFTTESVTKDFKERNLF